MTSESERYERLHVIYTQAAALPPADREQFLTGVCDGDVGLLHEVRQLLAAGDIIMPALEDEHADAVRNALREASSGPIGIEAAAWVPATVAQYRVLRLIGEGGMGAVYEAEQDAPRRRVALKLVPAHRATSERLRRFRHEAEVLGRLNHPGIARIYEAGSADLGFGAQPFFAMEFIDGTDIVTHAERAGLSIQQRLELMAEVADAVQYAHDQGVVHRDLKPDNVFIDDQGDVKVLDFGVARASETSDNVTTVVTHAGQLIGTLAYMSPEQLAGDADRVSGRSDVYALGVMMCEILTGRLPYEIRGLTTAAAITQLTEETASQVGALNPSLRGDVETIVGKALEKTPDRRYQTARELAADIRHYLVDEPIVARPPNRRYLAGKFIRRNRALVGGVVATTLALLAGLVIALLFAVDERKQRFATDQLLYRTSLMAASRATAAGERSVARAHLGDAPARLREWEWDVLDARLTPAEPILRIVPSRHSVVSSADGQRHATLSIEGQLLIWEGGQWDAVRKMSLEPRAGEIAFRSDGRRIVGIGGRVFPSWIGIYDPATGQQLSIAEIVGASDIDDWDLHPDGDRLAATLGDQLVVYDTATGGELALLPPIGPTSQIRYSPDGSTLAGSSRGQISLYDGNTLSPLQTFQAHTDSISELSFSSDGRSLASSSFDGTAAIWDLSHSPALQRTVMNGQVGGVFGIRFSPDDATVVTRGVEHAITVWDAATGEPMRVFTEHAAPPANICYSADSRWITSIDQTGVGHRWPVHPDEPHVLHGHASYVYDVDLDHIGGMIITSGFDGYSGDAPCLRWWDMETGDPVATWGDGPTYVRGGLDVSPDGRSIAVAVSNWRGPADKQQPLQQHVVVLLDARTGRLVDAVDTDLWILDVAYDPRGERMCLATNNARIVVLDAGTLRTTFDRTIGASRDGAVFGSVIRTIAWSPDGTTIAVNCDDGAIEIYPRDGGDRLARWRAHETEIRYLDFDPSGTRIVTCSSGGPIGVWDSRDSRELAMLDGAAQPLYATFSPDGTRLATGRRDGIVRIWETDTWTQVAELHGHEAYVYRLRWSPDGRALYSASGDHTARIWDARSDDEIRSARAARAEIVARLTPQIASMFAEHGDAGTVAEHVVADADMTARERQIALQLVLARSLQN